MPRFGQVMQASVTHVSNHVNSKVGQEPPDVDSNTYIRAQKVGLFHSHLCKGHHSLLQLLLLHAAQRRLGLHLQRGAMLRRKAAAMGKCQKAEAEGRGTSRRQGQTGKGKSAQGQGFLPWPPSAVTHHWGSLWSECCTAQTDW